MNCENGIFIYAEENAAVSDVRFCDCSLELVKKTDWAKNTHDIRPCEGKGIIEAPMNVISSTNALGIIFENFKWSASDEITAKMGDYIYSCESDLKFN